MAKKLVVYDDTTQTCGHATLAPYPAVVAGTNTTVTSSTGSDGKVTYTINAAGGGTADGNDVSTMTAAVTSGHIIGTHTAGGVTTTLRETVTTLTRSGASITLTNEAGTAQTVTLCSLIGALSSVGSIGG